MKLRLSLLSIPLAFLPAAFAQTQSTGSAEILCIKAKDGKQGELRRFLLDSSAKMGKYRVDSGVFSAYLIAEAVAPSGRSARCDFHLVQAYAAAPKGPLTSTEEDMKKAGISMTIAQRNAKRDEISYLVSREYWRVRDIVGTLVKGGYVRLNYFKINSNSQTEWLRMESSGWKQMAEVWAKESPGRAWVLQTLIMPGGATMPYNGLTVDGYPNWDALFATTNPRNTWGKVHPDSDYSAYMTRVGQLAERPLVSTMRLIEVIRK
ncbi:MAG: hypothetical protein JST93_30990 [Acidobacteria bacterium]|nr:hypothetical protein [Acidobacteriota bacterium]